MGRYVSPQHPCFPIPPGGKTGRGQGEGSPRTIPLPVSAHGGRGRGRGGCGRETFGPIGSCETLNPSARLYPHPTPPPPCPDRPATRRRTPPAAANVTPCQAVSILVRACQLGESAPG